MNVVFAWGVDNRSFHISTRDPEAAEQTFNLAAGLDAPVSALKALGVSRADVLCTVGLESYVDELLDRLGVPFDVTHLGYELIALGRHQMDANGRYIGDAALLSLAASVRRSGALPRYVQKAERRLACSRDAARRAELLMPGRPVIPVRIPESVNPHRVATCIEPLAPGEPLRVLVLGRLTPHKGLATLAELVRLVDSRNFPVAITCLGEVRVAVPEILANSRRVNVLGAYAQPELESIVRRVRPHLALLPFSIPETHSYALSDAMRLGLPVLATGIGAIPERVHGRPATWILDVQEATAEGFFQWLQRLYDDRLSTPAQWLPISHLPPIAEGFYDDNYLKPVLSSQ